MSMRYNFDDICKFINKRVYLFLPTTGTNKIVIWNAITKQEVGVIYNKTTNACDCFIIIAREILKYTIDNNITKEVSLNDNFLKQIFEDVVPKTE